VIIYFFLLQLHVSLVVEQKPGISYRQWKGPVKLSLQQLHIKAPISVHAQSKSSLAALINIICANILSWLQISV